MRIFLVMSLAGALVVGCDNDAELAKAQAEKATVEAELAKVRAEGEIAKAQTEADKARAASDALAKRAAESQLVNAELQRELAEAKAKNSTTSDSLGGHAPAEPKRFDVKPNVAITVQERKADGQPWDAMGGAPDVMVYLTTQSGTVESGVAQDQFTVRVSLGSLKLKAGDPIRITAIDKDAVQSDPIGNAIVVFNGPGRSESFAGGSMNGRIQF